MRRGFSWEFESLRRELLRELVFVARDGEPAVAMAAESERGRILLELLVCALEGAPRDVSFGEARSRVELALADMWAQEQLSDDQVLVVREFGYDARFLSAHELGAAIEEVVAAARAELERGRQGQYSELTNPAVVLDLFGRTFAPEPEQVLEILFDRPPKGLHGEQARARLDEEIERARRQAERVARDAKGGVGGDPLMLSGPSLSDQAVAMGRLRVAALEPRKGAPRDRDGYWLWHPPPGWENEGPWGDSLAWLEEQERPDPARPCERCNWPGRYSWLVGVDDGGDPRRAIGRAAPGSTGLRKPLLERYRARGERDDGREPLDHMQATGDRRCALCGGCGYVVVPEPDSESVATPEATLPRLISGYLEERDGRIFTVNVYEEYVPELARAEWARTEVLDRDREGRFSRQGVRTRRGGADDESDRLPLESVDGHGRLRPLWERAPEATDADEGEPAVDAEVRWGTEALDTFRDEATLARRIVAAAVLFREDARTLVEGTRVAAHKRDYEETPVLEPLAIRQFLADATFTGSGRTDSERRWAFQKRDAVIFELMTSGFPIDRISQAVGLSKKRLYSLDVVKTARQAFELNQRGLAARWHERGYSTGEIARASGLGLRTVQRLLEKGTQTASERPLREDPTMKFLGQALTYGQVLAEMQVFPEPWPPHRPLTLDEAREGIPIDYLHGVPYHTYVPGEQERFGAPSNGDSRSSSVLHPFLYALLSRTRTGSGAGPVRRRRHRGKSRAAAR
jgi:hypothetical protein